MRKIILGLALLGAMAASAAMAPRAQAQATDIPLDVTPFTAEANFMSKAGYYRYRYYDANNEWISYEQAARIVAEQGG